MAFNNDDRDLTTEVSPAKPLKRKAQALSDSYIKRKLAEKPETITFGPSTRKAFRELLEFRAKKRKTKARRSAKAN